MPNVSEKKKKLLYLWRILFEKTDGAHALTLPQIQDELSSQGVSSERKSLYDDIETLRSFGVEIGTRKSKCFQYFIEKRTFSREELFLLKEVICSSGLVSAGQAAALLEKLETLCSTYEAAELRRYTGASSPSVQEDAPAGLETVYQAIAENRKIAFSPLEWEITSEGRPMYSAGINGEILTFSPWKVLCRNRRYEVVGYHGKEKKVCSFFLDAISPPEILSESREGGEAVAAAESVADNQRTEKLVLEFSAKLLGAVTERFGTDFWAEPIGKNRFRAVLRAELPEDFFPWLFAQGTEIRLVAPKKLAEQFRESAKAIAKHYKN